MRNQTLGKALRSVRLALPSQVYPTVVKSSSSTTFLLDKTLQRTLSDFVRRTQMPLSMFVELVRGQTPTDYRPNKAIVPAVLDRVCAGYKHLKELRVLAREGVRVQLMKTPPRQDRPPANHSSALERVNVLRKNIRKEQDA